MNGQVVAVHRSARHAFSKQRVDRVHLLEGLGLVVLSTVARSGDVLADDRVTVELPPEPHRHLAKV